MSKYESDDIESLGADEIKDFCRHPLLRGNISEKDKEMSWDGNIEIHKKEGKKKTTFWRRIPIQIKSKCDTKKFKSTTLTFPIEKADLENYESEIGTLFLCVIFDDEGENFKVLYNMLYPEKIESILSATKSSVKKPSVEFKLLKTNSRNCFYSLIRNIAIEFDKRQANSKLAEISFEDFINKGYNKLTIEYYEKEIKAFTKSSEGYSLKIKSSDIEKLKILKNNDFKVYVDSKQYYDKTVYYGSGKNIKEVKGIKFGSIFEWDFKKLNINIDENTNINQLLYDLNFLTILYKTKEFLICDSKNSFKIGIEDIPDISLYEKLIEDIEELQKKNKICKYPYNDFTYKYLDCNLNQLNYVINYKNKQNEIISCVLNDKIHFFLKFKTKISFIEPNTFVAIDDFIVPAIIFKNDIALKYHDFKNQPIYNKIKDFDIEINDTTFPYINLFIINSLKLIIKEKDDLDDLDYLNDLTKTIEFLIDIINDNKSNLSDENKDLFTINNCLYRKIKNGNLEPFDIKKIERIRNAFLVKEKDELVNEIICSCEILLENGCAKSTIKEIKNSDFFDYPIYLLYKQKET